MQKVVISYDETQNSYAIISSKLIFLMKLSLIILSLQLSFAGILLAATASGQDLSKIKVKLELKNAGLAESLLALQSKSGIKFSFYEQLLDKENKKVTLQAADISVSDALKNILSNTNLRYKPFNDFVIIEAKPVLQQPGRISGKIVDDKGEILPGAAVKIIETGQSVQNNLDGAYSLSIKPGTYTLEISYISFQTQRITGVVVAEGKNTPLDVAMKTDTKGLKEVVVVSSYKRASVEGLYARQKNSLSMTDGLSAAQIARTPDNNVAQVLRRLPGVNINDGKFVTIRGLSERYNNYKLNGADMPSTEPNRKNFSFDVLPVGLVDNVVVAKTFTPDMSAEFAGGQVEVNTLAIPEKSFLSVSLGSGGNTNTTGKDIWAGKRFESDYLFGNAKERDWFGRDWNPVWYHDLQGGTSNLAKDFKNLEAANRMNAAVPNLWGMYRYKAAPMRNLSFSGGIPVTIGKNRLGLVIGGSYRHEENAEDYGSDHQLDSLNEQSNYDPFTRILASNRYSFVTGISGVGNLGWENGGNKVSWKNMYTNRFENNSFYQQLDPEDDPSDNVTVLNDPRRTELVQTRLEGTHKVWKDKLRVSWYADYNKLDREQFDERNMRGLMMNGTDAEGRNSYIEWGGTNNNYFGRVDGSYDHIFTGNLQESKKNYGADIEAPFNVAGLLQKIKAGYQGSHRDAKYSQYVLNIGVNKADFGAHSLDQIMIPERFLDSTFLYLPWGLNPEGDGYHGTLDVRSAFIMGDFTLLKKLHLSGGFRREDSRFFTDRVGTNSNGKWIDSTRRENKINWYPSANIIYNINDKINIRSSYSKTISRFDFREISNTLYFDVAQDMQLKGNSLLRNTYVENYDVRVEWYPSAEEIISVTGFYKSFKDPIEMLVYLEAGHAFGTPINLKNSTGKGLEVNLRKSLGFALPGSFLKEIYVTGNAMYMDMQVEFMQRVGYEVDAVRKRPLQDFVPFSVNAGLDWIGKRFGASVNYGTTGRKLTRSGEIESYDEYLAPRNVIDLQCRAQFFNKRLEVKVNVSDLLAQPFITYRNIGFKSDLHGWPESQRDYQVPYTDDLNYNAGKDWVNRKYKKGTNYSCAVNYRF